MVDQISIDTSELRAFATDLGHVAGSALPSVDAIMKKGAQNIKEEMASDLAESPSFGRAAPTVSYDSDYRPGQVAYEIGPDKDRGGKAGGAAHLLNIAYFGGANGGGASVDIDKPLRSEEPNILKQLDDYLGRIL